MTTSLDPGLPGGAGVTGQNPRLLGVPAARRWRARRGTAGSPPPGTSLSRAIKSGAFCGVRRSSAPGSSTTTRRVASTSTSRFWEMQLSELVALRT